MTSTIRETPEGLAFVRPGSHPDWTTTDHGRSTRQDFIGQGEPTVPEKCKRADHSVNADKMVGVPQGDSEMYRIGNVVWHSSEEEIPTPDVGISVGLGSDMLFAGEIPGPDGSESWGLALYPQDGERVTISRTVNSDAARDLIDRLGRLLTAAPQEAEPVAWRWETTSEHIARDMKEGRFPKQSERQRVPALRAHPAQQDAAMHTKDDEVSDLLADANNETAEMLLKNTRLRAENERLREALEYVDKYLTKLQTPGAEPLNSVNASCRKADRKYWTAQVRNEAREIWAVIGNVMNQGQTVDAARAALQRKAGE